MNLDLEDQSEDLNSKCPMANDSYNYCANEMKKENYDTNFRNETGLGAVP